MKRPARILPWLLLAALLACDRSLAERRRLVYAPQLAGLTLVYEDATLSPAQRFEGRMQKRVEASTATPAGQRVALAYSTLKSHNTFEFLSKDGGWVLVEGDTPLLRILPEGFPDRVDRWEDAVRGTSYRVIGRAALQDPSLVLPEEFTRVGVWVEMVPKQGPPSRIFFLPGIGEAANQELRGGRWVLVNHLVSLAFTDLPVATPAP